MAQEFQQTKKTFSLGELIVVISILIALATVAMCVLCWLLGCCRHY